MTQKRLVIEMGMGVDQHGQDPTVAAARAVRTPLPTMLYPACGRSLASAIPTK